MSSSTFSGSVIRMAIQSDEDPDAVWESWFLSLLPERQRAETMLEQIFRKSKSKWWQVDAFDFVDVPKREPSMVYQRHIPTTEPAEAFTRDYFDAPYTLRPGFDPYARNPRGFDPAVRGSVESRARELAVNQLAVQASSDDPWYDVNVAYEHYAARSLLKVADGYLEAVWLFSTGKDANPAEVIETAVEKQALRSRSVALGIVGPYPANENATISTGMRLTRAFRKYPGGIDEFESKIVTLSAWT